MVNFANLLKTSSYVPCRPVLIITDPCQLTLLSGVHSGDKQGVGPVLLRGENNTPTYKMGWLWESS